MERARRAALVVAIAFPVLHLVPWILLLPITAGSLASALRPGGGGFAGPFLLLLGGAAILAVAVAVRARARPTRERGEACIGLGVGYVAAILVAIAGVREAFDAAITEVGFLVFLPVLAIASLFGESAWGTVAIGATYPLALFLGGALTMRAPPPLPETLPGPGPGVDGRIAGR